MKRLESRMRIGWIVPLVLTLVCGSLALLAAGNPDWHRLLDYRREAIAAGSPWGLFTGHLMHLDAHHAALDLAGLWLVAWIFLDRPDPRDQTRVLLVGMVMVDAGLWWAHPEIERYVGLSGLLHALFAAGATRWLIEGISERSRARSAWGGLLLLGLATKLSFEASGRAFWLQDGFAVVTAAHRWGAAGGVLSALADRFLRPRA